MPIEATSIPMFREQLLDRRHKLEEADAVSGPLQDVTRLLQEVDAALRRIETARFGVCDTCGDSIEPDRLLADPLTRFCLDHLTTREQRALEQDLDLAARIQRGLLPRVDAPVDGWEIAYHYAPLGPVSGDYCDLIQGEGGDMHFLVGDVAGKGVAAAMLMSHLSAMLRMLVSVGLPLSQLMERASRVFCESTLPAHYATLVCGRASGTGAIEVCNAGHPPPLIIRRSGEIERIDATGLPIGMFCSESFTSQSVQLAPGETLLLYTDGFIEARNVAGEDYGIDRLYAFAASAGALRPREMVGRGASGLASFRGTRAAEDDLTMMAVRRL
jgi:sigma-B regulation protein RsbU (phosphoserine phosphatase)